MQILSADIIHIPTIRQIALPTWEYTYGELLSEAQSEYMLEMMYSEKALANQMENLGHHFLLIKENELAQGSGFVSYETNYKGQQKIKIHKLYILPEYHGMGLGEQLINHVASIGRQLQLEAITLNMNKYNKAYGFYKHIGFAKVGEEDINIGHGYLMEDYILEKEL